MGTKIIVTIIWILLIEFLYRLFNKPQGFRLLHGIILWCWFVPYFITSDSNNNLNKQDNMEHLIVSKPRENAVLTTVSCSSKDFFNTVEFINQQTCEQGYGLLVSNPIKHTYGDKNAYVYRESYRYIISNIVKSYTGNDIIEPLGEWDDVMEEIILYDSANAEFFNKSFIDVCNELNKNDSTSYKEI